MGECLSPKHQFTAIAYVPEHEIANEMKAAAAAAEREKKRGGGGRGLGRRHERAPDFVTHRYTWFVWPAGLGSKILNRYV